MSIESGRKLLKKSKSMPHISSKNDIGFSFNGGGSCSILDQIGIQPNYDAKPQDQHNGKVFKFKLLLLRTAKLILTSK